MKEGGGVVSMGNSALEEVAHFNYLGSEKEIGGSCSLDIRKRIGMAKTRMGELNYIWKDCNIGWTVKKKLIKSLVFSVVLYAAESWVVKKADGDRLDALECFVWRRALNICYTDRVRNEEVFLRAGEERWLLQEVNRRRMKYYGHCSRGSAGELMSCLVEGTVDGRERLDGRKASWQGDIRKLSGCVCVRNCRRGDRVCVCLTALKRKAEDRGDYRKVVWEAALAREVEDERRRCGRLENARRGRSHVVLNRHPDDGGT
jgi:hypothetical protein